MSEDLQATVMSTPGNAQAIIDAVQALHGGQTLRIIHPDDTVESVPVGLLPKGMELRDLSGFLDPWRDHPRRRQGTATLLDLTSFIDHVRRFSTEDTGIFCDNRWRPPTPDEAERAERVRDPNGGWKTPSLTAVLDYHDALTLIAPNGNVLREDVGESLPRFCTHRAHYAFPLSEEFMSWMAGNGEAMTQGDFAAFLEERSLDVEPPPVGDAHFDGMDDTVPTDAGVAERKHIQFMMLLRKMTQRLNGHWAGPERMMDLSRGLRINERNTVEGAKDVSSGQVSLVFKNEHTDESGEPVRVPNLFLISIPIFRNGPHYLLPVRLRYRIQGGRVLWFYDAFRTDRVFDHALGEALERVEAETGLAVLVGTPEA